MFCKSVSLHLFCSNTPAQVTIMDELGNVISRTTVSLCHNKICLRTSARTLIIMARYQNQVLYQAIRLCCCYCQTAYARFIFNAPQQIRVNLHDANYGFPISRAVLTFRNQL